MRKITIVAPALMLAAALLAGCAAPAGTAAPGDKLLVCTSFYPMYDFARKIGGDKIALTNLVPAGIEPHDWEPVVADIVDLERADVFLYNGVGMEHWVDDVLASLQNESLLAVETAADVPLLDNQQDDEDAPAHADHGQHDPHVWLNPLNVKIQMAAISRAFAQADPDNAAYYEANYQHYAAELDKLDDEFRTALSPLPRKDIVVAHQAFGYLCAAYGLNQVPIEGLSPDSEPTPARMAAIIDFARHNDVGTIFFEEMVNPKVAQTIADAIGAHTAVLSPVEGLSDEQQAAGDDYFSVMRQNLTALTQALQD
ncbi:MAG: metal ABC transporter substrate-binding protein [Eubacteriales bacterium]|nr:metal ABC transporter substrate-binding protein [Eubacteriales bacterium]